MLGTITRAAVACTFLFACTTMSGSYRAAIADPGRPAADRQRDEARRPESMLQFARVRRGMTIAEIVPGEGYFTRLFARAVGTSGRVYALVAQEQLATPTGPSAIVRLTQDPAYSNVQLVITRDRFASGINVPAPVDMVWTSRNYHDFRDPRVHIDVLAFNRSVYRALRPGGIYVIVDHAATPGADVSAALALHRVDSALVRRDLQAAGFEFVGESTALANPADNRTLTVFNPTIRDRTDQFVLMFRRPRTTR